MLCPLECGERLLRAAFDSDTESLARRRESGAQKTLAALQTAEEFILLY